MKRYEEKQPVFLEMPRRPIGTNETNGTHETHDPEQATWAEVGAGVFTWLIVCAVALIAMGIVARVACGFIGFGWHIFDRVLGL